MADDMTFCLSGTPSGARRKARLEAVKHSCNTAQTLLFDAGKNDLVGQQLLFNSDAGDLHNPKTQENRNAR